MARKNYFLILSLIYLTIFIILLPVALRINYQHNDDWVYYSTVSNFLKGIIAVHPYSAASFYSIGFLATAFAKVFGIEQVPVLTLFVSVFSIFILNLIIIKYYKTRFGDSVIISFLVLVNPIFVYSMWGFMTENYFLFFCLLALYFVFGFNSRVNEKANFILCNLFIVIAYLARQLGLVISLAFIFNLLWTRKYKYAFAQSLVFMALLYYHFFIFPKGSEAFENKFVFLNLIYIRYLASLFYTILIYLAAFLIPLFLVIVVRFLKSGAKRRGIAVLLLTLGVVVFMTFYFKNIGWIGERFYYLNYTVNINGFFPENLHGVKSPALLINLFYPILDKISKFAGVVTLIYVFAVLRKKSVRENNIGLSISLPILLVYFLMLAISVRVYDRYLVLLFPVALLAVLPRNINLKGREKSLILVFTLIIGFYSYNYSADYIITNSHVWSKANEIYETEGISRNDIVTTDAWDYVYPQSKNIVYKFTYDDPTKQNYSKDYQLVEKFKVSFPFSIWRNNNIYLYKKIDVVSVKL